MAQAGIVEFPVAAGGVLRVQAVDGLPGDELVPASKVGDTVARARETLETALGSVTPALGVISTQLKKLAPDEVTVEFGLVLSVEHGIVVTKGKGEVHFTVTLAWKPAAETEQETTADLVLLDGGDGEGGGD